MTDSIEADMKYFIEQAKKFGSEWRALFITPTQAHAKIWMRGLALTAENEDVHTFTNLAHMTVEVNNAIAYFVPQYKGCSFRMDGKGPFPQIVGIEHLHEEEDRARIVPQNRGNAETEKYLRRT